MLTFCIVQLPPAKPSEIAARPSRRRRSHPASAPLTFSAAARIRPFFPPPPASASHRGCFACWPSGRRCRCGRAGRRRGPGRDLARGGRAQCWSGTWSGTPAGDSVCPPATWSACEPAPSPANGTEIGSGSSCCAWSSWRAWSGTNSASGSGPSRAPQQTPVWRSSARPQRDLQDPTRGRRVHHVHLAGSFAQQAQGPAATVRQDGGGGPTLKRGILLLPPPQDPLRSPTMHLTGASKKGKAPQSSTEMSEEEVIRGFPGIAECAREYAKRSGERVATTKTLEWFRGSRCVTEKPDSVQVPAREVYERCQMGTEPVSEAELRSRNPSLFQI